MFKILKFTIITILIFGWIFGYPPVYENFWRARIWQNPPIPPEIQEAQAALLTILLLTAVLAFAIIGILNPSRAYFSRCGVLFCGKIIS